MILCHFCREPLHQDRGVWVDATDGDCCSGDDELRNENGRHSAREVISFDDVTTEKFKEVADEMDAEWASLMANPLVQDFMAGWEEAINSELPPEST